MIRVEATAAGETLYRPADRAVRGGIVCLHGSEGGWAGWNDVACAMFAAAGFAALPRNYSPPTDGLTRPDIDRVPLEGTAAALDAMRDAVAGDGCGVGLYGVSRGAEHALLLSGLLPPDRRPDALALHSPPDATWPAFRVDDFRGGGAWAGDSARPAWTWQGTSAQTRPGLPLGEGLGSCPVLIAQGTADEIWDPDMAERLAARLRTAGTPVALHRFPGEPHLFRPAARTREWGLLTAFFARHLAAGAARG